jgi:Domain of unknown function (DUF4175)
MMDRLLRREATPTEPATPDSQLHALLGRVRRRWRLRVALRGLAFALAGVLAVVVLASVALEQSRWADESVAAARVVAWLTVVALLAWWVARPLLARVPAQRVALYLEEHDPSLDAALVSAVEQVEGARAGAALDARAPYSPVMRERLVASAVERAKRVEARDPERPQLVRAGGTVAGLVAVAALLLAFGPQALRQGARVLLVPWSTAEAAEALAVAVEPGDARLAKGGDQEISAHLRGFVSDDAELAVRRGDAGTWERIPMSAGRDSGTFVARLFDLDERTQYFVEANGVRSPVFTLDVANLPTVRRLDLEYRYPAYTGLAPQRVDDGGDIAAPKGTVVRVRVTTTMPVQQAQLVVDGQAPVAMTRDSSGAMVGELRVQAAGFYHVELQAADGGSAQPLRGSLDYAIDVLDDNAPTVTFKSPGRDIKVTSLEEVFAEVVAEDDYGVQSLELVYAVNGGAEQAVALHKGGPRREVTGGHTFYLEEQSLSPGDVVSYYARAKDGTAHTSATDIYFMEVRPFEKEYRQAEQAGGQQQQGEGGEESPSALTRRQREIVAATFKVVRDSVRLSASERRDNVSTIALSQGQLRERVETLARRLSMRGVAGADSALAVVAEELPKAAAAMQEAEERLGRSRAGEALPPEQKALQHLQRAEAAYREVQVAFGQQQGGGGQGEQRNPDELADLFELDVDKMRNQYESVQRGGRSEANDRKVDETLEKLRALAQRQQQENERARRRAEAMQQGGGGGGGQSQRQLAEETAEAARQLERLARERQSQELAESARRLQDAANAMRRSAASGKDAGTAEGAAALDRLQDARRLIDKERTGRVTQDARDAQRAAEELAERQKAIAKDVDRLQVGGGRDQALAGQLNQRKEQLAKDVEQLEGQLDRLSRDARRDQRDAARKLQDAAGGIRERRVADKVRYSRNTMRTATPEYAKAFEEQIASDLGRTREQVAEAVGAMGQSSGSEQGQQALDKARELARGLESLRERAQQGREPGAGSREPGQTPGQQHGGQQQGGQQQGGQQGGRQQGNAPQGAAGQPGRMGGAGQGASVGGAPEPVTPEQMRQWMREYRERRTDAEGLRRALQGTGVDVSQLEQTIRGLRALEGSAPYRDPAGLARLQEQVTEGFKAFEFTLRRQLASGDDARPVLGGAQEVSPKYRAMVEEYYRSLGRGKQ